jgi:hypothetical protein
MRASSMPSADAGVLLKGCEQPFHPKQASERYCSGGRREKAPEWSEWKAQQKYRATPAGKEKHLGRSDFLYVADSKLCVSKTLSNIDRRQGRFITVVPRTRSEVEEFQHKVEALFVRWEKVCAGARAGSTGESISTK